MEDLETSKKQVNRYPEPEINEEFIIPGQGETVKVRRKGWQSFFDFRNNFPPYIFFIISLYLTQIALFSGFRLIFLMTNYQKIDPGTYKFLKLVIYYGFKFDTIVSSFILLVPFVFLSVDYFFEWNKRWFYRLVKIYLRILLITSFLICSADIPFFAFFNSRLTSSALLWKDNAGEMFNYILGDSSKYPYLLLLVFASALFVYLLVRLQGRLFNENLKGIRHTIRHKILVTVLFSSLLFTGLRGGITENPLHLSNLTTSNHFFVNQLSWNPILSFFESFNGFSLNYLDQQKAIENAKRYLGGEDYFDSPIARQITFSGDPVKANVILVLMESMSASKMGMFGNSDNLTPNLDKIASGGICFRNFYTSGIHTCNGIYSSLFGFPSLMNEHPMNNLQSTSQPFTGLMKTLLHNNYQTAFITTNDENFDNMGYFVRNNGCQYVYGMKDFDKRKIVNTWGPPDEELFNFSLKKLDQLYKNKTPFFATLVTISSHDPYTIPSYTSFKSNLNSKVNRAYAYADWSIGNFMEACKSQPWFENTVFVFSADHGINSNSGYEIPLSFHHSPLIIYAPGMKIDSADVAKPATQFDIFPTIMGLLKIPYVNNTFGIDLLNEKRPFAFFTHDDKLGCMDENYFLIVNKEGKRMLYNYRLNGKQDLSEGNKPLADSMQTYSMSMLQTAQWILLNRKAGPMYRLN